KPYKLLKKSNNKEKEQRAREKQKQSESHKEEALQKTTRTQEQEEENNPATYLVNFCEEDQILFSINKELSKEQYTKAKELLQENNSIFA
ncbi:8311_t:CDS:2, partial [Gigaspora margarita]